MVEVSSFNWYVAYMRLHSRGVIPTVTPAEYMPSRRALAGFFTHRIGHGYVFSDHGLPEYELYVRELYSRVLQLPWPLTSVMPSEFARGLLVEAMGVEVNWAEFAFRQAHPRPALSGAPRILPEYTALSDPLPPLAIVMPRAHLCVIPPMLLFVHVSVISLNSWLV